MCEYAKRLLRTSRLVKPLAVSSIYKDLGLRRSYCPRTLFRSASRGLGLEFCRQVLSSSPSDIVFATCRSPETATRLKDLQTRVTSADRLIVTKLDLADEASIQDAAASVGEYLKEKNLRLDYILNNAAVVRVDTPINDCSVKGDARCHTTAR